jgi:hypothetical protein
MTHLHPTPPPKPLSPATAWHQASGQPAGHLVCDLDGRVCWTDDIAERLLASAEVVLVQADGRLGVRSHRLGLLALRSAMRLTVLGTPAEPITLRHGRDELRVGVHALPEAADGTARVLLSLRPAPPHPAASAARHPWSNHA